jgi:hypothetical protein
MNNVIDIDYAAPSSMAYQRVTPISMVLLVSAIVLLAYLFQQYQQASDALALEETKQVSIMPTQLPVATEAIVETASADEVKYAREVVAQLSIAWNPLFASLEQSNMPTIALLGIEPNRKKQQLILTGQAKNMESTLAYIRRLEQTATLSDVHLLQHNIDQNDPFKPLAFTITARWTP